MHSSSKIVFGERSSIFADLIMTTQSPHRHRTLFLPSAPVPVIDGIQARRDARDTVLGPTWRQKQSHETNMFPVIEHSNIVTPYFFLLFTPLESLECFEIDAWCCFGCFVSIHMLGPSFPVCWHSEPNHTRSLANIPKDAKKKLFFTSTQEIGVRTNIYGWFMPLFCQFFSNKSGLHVVCT